MIYNQIKKIYPDIPDDAFTLRDDLDGNGPYIDSWMYDKPKPSKKDLDAVKDTVEKETNTAALIAEIKRIASEKILAIAPIWKQNDMLAEAIEAVANGDTVKIQELYAVWARVQAIRKYSNDLEDIVMTHPQIDIYAGWPE